MHIIGSLLGFALTLFMLLLLARVVLDWIAILAESPTWTNKVRAFTHTWTEPVIAPVRKVLRPIRAGGLSIDLAFTAVFIAVLILRSIAFSF
ncbi:YggT family protein [Nocardia panacis]|uniref:YggT family protein n=1 Tax=Nocardia panacis TaxID=2340916 RepID=A0A3A4K057_9NOCA|nr:YggT family protein [Nocardia panacis]RJO72959.1 YggT family protein [Nocardia panacis]